MANDIKLDIIEGGGRETIDRGWEFRRTVIVYNITGAGNAKIFNAANVAGMPQLRDPYPARENCILRERTPEIIDDTTVKFTLVYADIWWEPSGGSYSQPPSYGTIQTGTSLIEGETGVAREGQQIYVRYKGVKYPVIVPIFKPESNLTITKLLNFDPSDLADAYVGKLNAAGWNLKPTAPQGSWLCTGIVGISSDGGLTYPTTFSFQKKTIIGNDYFSGNLEGWDVIAYYRGENGLPPEDCINQTSGALLDGADTWHVLELADFNDLNLIVGGN